MPIRRWLQLNTDKHGRLALVHPVFIQAFLAGREWRERGRILQEHLKFLATIEVDKVFHDLVESFGNGTHRTMLTRLL